MSINEKMSMKLKAFRIKNYRSVVDSGWCQLSPDNITGIIGQNESGKTSILEALKGFYDGEITDDVLRSDLSMPEVSCAFEVSHEKIRRAIDIQKIPDGLLTALRKEKNLVLQRVWSDDKSSRILCGGPEVEKVYTRMQDKLMAYDKALKKKIDRTIDNTERAKDHLKKLSLDKVKYLKKLELIKAGYSVQEKKMKRQTVQAEKTRIERELQRIREQIREMQRKIEDITRSAHADSARLDELIPKMEVSVAVLDTERKVMHAEERRKEVFAELAQLQMQLEYTPGERELRSVQLKLDVTQDMYLQANKEWQQRKEENERKKHVATLVLQGTDLRHAIRETEEWFRETRSVYSREEMGSELFQLVPSFELFEDFSSLLPNRIDLSEIVKEKSQSEGFKAVRNFLVVSGLTPAFFNNANTRILKQKIEKLNQETTLDFQEYWRQSLGKNNRIKVVFELEHYDASHPGKVGQPYLEFWIMDEYERLYPKQRSRGVRWFLSFYLELKASAIRQETDHRVLLIDEPGLSLHARAQEDVLKVFEDIKNRIQIVYTTHSPHLIDLDKLYRLLAVQRKDIEDERSETAVFDARSLQEASSDTLSPIYTLMGSRITEQKFIQPKNNIILEDVSTYYYLTTILRMLDFDRDVFLLPATHVTNVNVLVNLLMGWGMDFLVILDDDEDGNRVYNDMKANLFDNSDGKIRKKVLKLDTFRSFEDLFSTIDFKKYILNKREGIPESNSEYIQNNALSKSILASGFKQRVQDERVLFSHFDEETRENMTQLMEKIRTMLA